MIQTRQQITAGFASPELVDHPSVRGAKTLQFLAGWNNKPLTAELPRLKVEVHGIDYLCMAPPTAQPSAPIRFQQDCYRLWYQAEGQGILQNATKKTFGTARPGLLGIMEPGERHTYLHQKGSFECFQIDFSMVPSLQAKCYWNSEIEGKCVLENDEKLLFENHAFGLLRSISLKREMMGVATLAGLLDIVTVLLEKGLVIIQDKQFPKDKAKSLVEKMKHYMLANYATLHHQKALEHHCAMDINYLNILFRNATGKTLYSYLTDVRIEHAKHLLQEHGLSVADVASRVGYPNCNSFTRVFRKRCHATPTEYQRKANPAQGEGETYGPEVRSATFVRPEFGGQAKTGGLPRKICAESAIPAERPQ